MKKSVITLIFCVMTICCLLPQTLIAKTGYVSDMLLLTFREGPGTSYSVLKTLQSDTPVVILEEKDGFYKVELKSNEIGWVDKKFIVFDTPKAQIINELEQTIASLEKKVQDHLAKQKELTDRLNASNNENVQKIQTLESDLQKTLREKQTTAKALAESQGKYNTLLEQSKDIQHIIKENASLKTMNEKLSADLETSKKMNKNLFKTGMIKWFLAGVATLLVGWILGQSVSSRKRSGSILLD